MRITPLILSTAVIGTFLQGAPETSLADDGPLLDAGFETELSPDEGGWQVFEDSVLSTKHARSGERSMLNGGFSRTVSYQPFFTGGVSGSFQEHPAAPGSRWRLTGFAYTADKLKGVPAFGVIQVSFFDAEGNDLGTVETAGGEHGAKTSSEVNNQSPVGEWIHLDTGIATAPEGTAAIQAFTLFVDYSSSNQPQGVFFDDLTLCAVSDDDGTHCDGD